MIKNKYIIYILLCCNILAINLMALDQWADSYVIEKKNYYLVKGIASHQKKEVAKLHAIQDAEKKLLFFLNHNDNKLKTKKLNFNQSNSDLTISNKTLSKYKIKKSKPYKENYKKNKYTTFGRKDISFDYWVKLKIKKKDLIKNKKHKLLLFSTNSQFVTSLNKRFLDHYILFVSDHNKADTMVTINYHVKTNIKDNMYKCDVQANLDLYNKNIGQIKIDYNDFGYGKDENIAIDNAKKNISDIIYADLQEVIK